MQRQPEIGRDLCTVETGAGDPDRHLQAAPGTACTGPPAGSSPSIRRLPVESSPRSRATLKARSPRCDLVRSGARPSPSLTRPGCSTARVPNCSATRRGTWFGNMMPPAPIRIVLVMAATWASATAVAALAIPGRL
jgi:hypothetical protein